MQVTNLTSKQPSNSSKAISFALDLKKLKEIFIFNCCQGCQNTLNEKRIKISHVSRIIITELNIVNTSGLMGLLSSLSLINRTKELHIYAPKGLEQYIKLGKKYSQTNFRYNLYIHVLATGIVINNSIYKVYTFAEHLKFNFLIIFQEKYGKFRSNKAKDFSLVSGPLYGKLKQGNTFLSPDGIVIKGKDFTQNNSKGTKITYLENYYCRRSYVEIAIESRTIHNIL